MAGSETKSEVKREVTSLKVNPELWKKAKLQAVTEGITLGELLDQALGIRLSPQAAELLKKYGRKA